MAIHSTKAANDKKRFWERLSERERYQLVGLGVFLCLMATIVGVVLFQQQMEDIEAATTRYETALDFLATAGPAYADRVNQASAEATHKKIDDETLTKNDIKLTSFVAGHAEKAKITISSYDEDQLPFGNKNPGGPIIIEKQLRIDIRGAKMSQLMELLDKIEQSDEPVFVKRLDLRAQRKTPGEVKAIVTVSTFVKKPPAEG